MLDRFMSLMKGMLNKGMSKMETPEVLAEQAEMELESNLKKIAEALTSGLTSEKMLEQKIAKNSQDLSLWEKRALIAVQKNDDELARECLAKKQEQAQSAQALDSQLTEQKKTNIALKENQAELKQKLQEFRLKKGELLARMKSQDNAEKANQLVANSGSSSGMDKWEQKIAEKEARGQALKELSPSNKVDAQFAELDKQGALEDELAALKASSSTSKEPRLIEAKEASTKAQVDENLPMVVEVIDPNDDNGKKN